MPRLFFIVASDPRLSPRPAEAVRIAAGLSAWDRLALAIAFWQDAARALAADTAELQDEETFRQCLPLLTQHHCAIYQGPGKSIPRAPASPQLPGEIIDEPRLAILAADSDYVIRF